MQLNEIDEIRQDVVQRTILIQNKRTKWHDKFSKRFFFQVIGPYCFTQD